MSGQTHSPGGIMESNNRSEKGSVKGIQLLNEVAITILSIFSRVKKYILLVGNNRST
jgi:hypothetical protein